MSLSTYKKKRDFKKTKEPAPSRKKKSSKDIFVVQRHNASHLHYDFRIQMKGVLKSWALPKGLPKTSKEKRLAVHTEDHPLAYADFEGTIPEGEYGAGKVKIWDKGTFIHPKKGALSTWYKKGHIELYLEGKRYKGPYALIHFKGKNWLMIKMKKNPLKEGD